MGRRKTKSEDTNFQASSNVNYWIWTWILESTYLPGFESWVYHLLHEHHQATLTLLCSVSSLNGNNNHAYLTNLVWGLNEIIYIKNSSQCLAHGEPSKSFNYHNVYSTDNSGFTISASRKVMSNFNVLKTSQVSFFILLGVSTAEW